MQRCELTQRNGPLQGYRVLELGSTVAGPFCGRMFADFGAEVIKVEPLEGDVVRSIGPQYQGKSLYASSIFRNKSLIAVDLRTPEGQDIVRKIAAQSDFVIENFKPGTLEKWRIGYEDLRALNPRLIMVRISGYGQTGPYSKRPGYGITCEAVGGLRHLTGDPDRPPARVAVPLTDYITGLYAFSGALLALTERTRTGEGQCVDAALYESAFSLMEQHIAGYEKCGAVPGRMGAGTGSAPNNLYATSDGQWVHIAANSESVFRRLMRVISREDVVADARFSTPVARGVNRAVLDPIISQWTLTRTAIDIENCLLENDVPATRVFTLDDIFKDPHYRARGAIVDMPDEDLGSIAAAMPVPLLSGTPGGVRHSGRRIGQDTLRVLREVAGLSDVRIDELRKAGVIGTDAAPSTPKRNRNRGSKSGEVKNRDE